MAEAPPSESPLRRAFRHPLVRRLPLLIIGLLGIWLWRTSVGSEHEIVWQLPPSVGQLERLEIQLHNRDGELVKREGWFFDHQRPSEVTQKVKTPNGDYDAQIFFTRGGQTQSVRMPVHIEGDTILVRVRPP